MDESNVTVSISLTRKQQGALYMKSLAQAKEIKRLNALLNTPETQDFIKGVTLEAAHQRAKWGMAHDRSKSAENWFWLVGYLAGKALRAVITGDKKKALHHTISSAAALANWHAAIMAENTGAGIGDDAGVKPKCLAITGDGFPGASFDAVL